MGEKIAVFDSGLGGLTVLAALKKALPYEDFVYFGDSAHAPYGTKTDAELLRLCSATINKLSKDYDIKCFVCGCNTTTSRIWDELCLRFADYNFVGISPALDWAVAENPRGSVLLMGTDATIKSKKIKDRLRCLESRAKVNVISGQEIVMAVENQSVESEAFKNYLYSLLKPYADETDAIVLGCTHFPFVREKIARLMKKKVRFYDAAVVVAAETDKFLKTNHLLKSQKSPGSILYLNSDLLKVPLEEKLLLEYKPT